MLLYDEVYLMGIYETLGVRRIVNASGTMTVLGGSLIEKETIEAMNDAAKSFVFMDELMDKAGKIVAQITGAEAAIITSGTAASLTLAAAACMTGKDLTKINKLPDTSGMKNEIIIQRLHRNAFDNCIRNSGAKLVEVGNSWSTPQWEMEAAINDKTAAIAYFVLNPQPGLLPVQDVLDIAKKQGIPVIVDAAGELPPVENLKAFVSLGADLVLFSGGKQIAGPSDSGILCGRRDLVEAASMNSFLNYFGWYGIGRTMKISKEQIVGLVVALQRYVAKDYNAEMERWRKMAEYMSEELRDLPGLDVIVTTKSGLSPLCIPRVVISLNEERGGITVSDVVNSLREGNPPIAVWSEPSIESIYINPQCLLDGEERIVANRLKEILIAKSHSE